MRAVADNAGLIPEEYANYQFHHSEQILQLMACTESATDDFASDSYTGGMGWASDWIEVSNGSSATEPDGDDAGQIQIVGNRMRFQGINGADPYIYRVVDLSGSTNATLTFDLMTSMNMSSNDDFELQLSNDGGATWTLIDTYFGNEPGASYGYSLDAFASANTAIRFGTPFGVADAGEFFYLDNVKIQAFCTCDLTVNYEAMGCVDNNDGTFTTTYDLVVDWKGMVPAGDITLSLAGDGNLSTTTISAATVAGGSSTTLAGALTIPADGDGTTMVHAEFNNDAACSDDVELKAPRPCPNDVPTCASASGCVGGSVFEDYDFDGVNDAGEPGLRGMRIEVYDCTNTLSGVSYADDEGDWQVCGLTDGTAYRVEFVAPENIDCWAKSTPVGADNASNVQFVTAPACANYSLTSPGLCCQPNPDVVLPCFVAGDPLVAGSDWGAADALISFPYLSSNPEGQTSYSSTVNHDAIGSEIGPTWGLAYQRNTERIFAAAFLKRHVGMGSLGLGGIYTIDYSGATPAAANFVDVVADLGIDVGTIPVNGAGGRDLVADSSTPTNDPEVFPLIAAVGLGDIEISDDGRTLYFINLKEKTLNALIIDSDGNPATTPTAADLTVYPIPDPGCSGGETRPFALKLYRGHLYVGLVCDASVSQSAADLDAIVYKFDGESFQTVINFDLDYTKGHAYARSSNWGTCNLFSDWHPWTGVMQEECRVTGGGSPMIVYPQPLLTDIEFDNTGSIIMAFTDRTGHQVGYLNFAPYEDDDFWISSGGDILRAEPDDDGSFTLENNASSGGVTTTGAGNNEGPGGGEYYYEEFFRSTSGTLFHSELGFGALAWLPGTQEVMMTAYDPVIGSTTPFTETAGVMIFDNTDGSKDRGFIVYDYDAAADLNFGKANGLGDLELRCEIAPTEIGNYIWCDSLNNGIQDACERGIRGINVELYDRNGALVGVTTSSTAGEYYFNASNVDTTGVAANGTPNTAFSGVSLGVQYYIVFGNSQFSGGEFNNGSETFGITSMVNTGANDRIDSDVDGSSLSTALGAMPAGLPFVTFTTPSLGCANHDFDLGVTCVEVTTTSCTTQFQDFQNLNFITIDDLNNPADGASYSTTVNGSPVVHNDPNQVGRGSVNYQYSIADRPITTTDWVIYLNAVDMGNTNGTFHGSGANGVRHNGTMWIVDALSSMNGGGGVTTNASAGNFPITNISLNQAAHYLNWVNTGNVDSGPYTFVTANDGSANIAAYDANHVGPRLPFVDEWYKAMFWDQANTTYNLFPTTNLDGNGLPVSTTVDGQGIHADGTAAFYDFPTNNYYAQVGQGTPSPYGLYDGAGNRHDILLNSPTDLSIIAKVGRWQDGEARQRSSYVESFASDEATPYLSVGFRPVCGAAMFCTNPSASIFAIQPSCTNGSPNADGYLQISAVNNGDRFNFSTGNTYTSDPDYANATNIGALPFQFNTGLSNPTGSQDYTVRVFNGASDCFTDFVVTMNEQDCTVGCDCTDYLILNDPQTDNVNDGFVHKFRINSDSTFTEIFSNPPTNTQPWIPVGSGIGSPHGLGVDLNGFYYIGGDDSGGIRKIDCDGNVFPTGDFFINEFSYNLTSYEGILYSNPDFSGDDTRITAYDPCDGSQIGWVHIDTTGTLGRRDWGFEINPNGTFYVSTGYSEIGNQGDFNIYVFTPTLADFTNHTVYSPTITNASFPAISNSIELFGVTTDELGNIYTVVWDYGNNFALFPEFNTVILKFDAAGNLLDQASEPGDGVAGGTGYNGSRGIKYYEKLGLLFLSGLDDCVAIVDPATLDYIGTGIGYVPSQNPKALAISTECCPTNNNLVIDTTLCAAAVNDKLFLQELINCNGPICEGIWTPSGVTGLTYNSCDNTVVINNAGACGTFTLNSDGTGNNPQCGAFKITVNITINSLDLTVTQTSCVDNSNGTFTANYDAVINWSSEPCQAGEMINVTHNGASIGMIDPSTDTSPSTFPIAIAADGNGTNAIKAEFTIAGCADSTSFKAPVPCPNDVATCASTSGCIGGSVFEDFNCNGTDDVNEGGVQGIQINIYDCNNALVGTGYSDEQGDWQICGLTDGTAYRVEHVLPEAVACWATPTHVAGGGNQSDIQFLTAPACTQFSVSSPADYCDNNPLIATNCFVNGDQSAARDALVGIRYDESGAVQHIALDNQIGSTWGMAYRPNGSTLFTASVLKRHAGFGTGKDGISHTEDDISAIYVIDYTSPTGTGGGAIAAVIDLADYGVNVGLNPRANSTPANDLSGPTDASYDYDVFDNIGRRGIGDIDISDDGNTLYVINLNEAGPELIILDVSTPTAPTLIQKISIPDPGCPGGDSFAPWALKVRKGEVYIGSVCTGDISLSNANLRAYVQKWNGSFSNVDLDATSADDYIPLDYERTCTYHFEGTPVCLDANWQYWNNDKNKTSTQWRNSTSPQPILSDIEFADDGSMILGFIDRSAYQLGDNNYSPDLGEAELVNYVSGGELRYVCNSGTTANPVYTVEGSGSCSQGNSPIYNGGAAIPNRHFNTFSVAATGSDSEGHGEIAFGGVGILPGTGQLVFSAMNPEDFYDSGIEYAESQYNAGGLRWVSTETGQTQANYTLYDTDTDPAGAFGKAAGLGDVEMLCAPAPLEIGNYVWCDSLQNGIQDACERGINRILVSLYDRNGVLVGQDTTSNSGQYYFNENNVDSTGITINGSGIATPNSGNFTGMSYNTQYFIVFGNGQFNNTDGEFNNGSETFGITSMVNAGSNDNIDSDVDGNNLTTANNQIPANLPFIDMTTSATGCGDHKYDLGVTCVAACSLDITATQASCVDNTDGTFTATYDINVNWENPPATGDVTLTLAGDGTLNTTTVSAATIAGGTSTTLAGALTVPADGNGTTMVSAAFNDDATCTADFTLKAPVPCPNDVTPCASTAGCIGGNVFDDNNCNGIDDTEDGVQGIQVNIYDCANMLIGTGYSDSEGDWQVCGLNDGDTYRVEFILPETVACDYNPTHVGTDNNSNVQFVESPACTNFSVSNPNSYCSGDPFVAAACFVRDAADGPYSDFSSVALFRQSWNGTSTTVGVEYIPVATHEQTGSINGIAVNTANQTIYAAAYAKRGSGFGPGGPGAIYGIDQNTGTVSVFATLNAGTDPRNYTVDSVYNAHRVSIYDHDPEMYQNVAELSIGDIDIDDANQFLYAANMGQKTLDIIEIANPTNIVSIPMPDFDCPKEDGVDILDDPGNIVPFAVEYHGGKVYFGITCTYKNDTRTIFTGAHKLLDYFVFEFDPTTNTFNNTPVMSFEGYNRPADNMNNAAYQFSTSPTPRERIHRYALSDIDFDNENNMYIAIRNLTGDYNSALFHPDTTQTAPSTISNSQGEIVKACWNGASWDLENNGICGGVTGASTAADGPGMGEFFQDSMRFHNEASFGHLVYYPENDQLGLMVVNPQYQANNPTVNSAGLQWYNPDTGEKLHAYRLYQGGGGFFAKIDGVGDAQLICDPAPLEVGNYIWCDSLENGIQDACERGQNGILVQLYDRNGILVGQDTSSNSGQYYFNENNVDTTGIVIDGSGIAAPNSGIFTGMSFNTQYFIVFGNGQYSNSSFNVGSEVYTVSAMNDAGSNDNIDSDVDVSNLTAGSLGNRPDGLPFIDLTTDAQGCANHNYDLALGCEQPTFSLGNRVFSDDDNSGDQNGTEAGIDGVQLQLLNDDGTVYDSDPNTAGTQALTVTTANGGYYRFDDLPAGDYIVEVVASNFNSGNALDMLETSTGANQEADPNNNGDLNDNGLDTPVSGAIRSAIVTLAPNEPTGEAEPGTYGAGSTTGTAAADDFSNLTVDFGFISIPIETTPVNPLFPPCPDQPCHIVNTDLRMGATLSADDPAGNGTDDADGTVFPNNLRAGTTVRLRTTITNDTGNDAYLFAWADFNNDDDFDDPGENFIVAVYPAAMFSGTYEVSNPMVIPSDATMEGIAIRFRLSSDQTGASTPCSPAGCAADGEVEDYLIQLACPPTICLPVQIQINRD